PSFGWSTGSPTAIPRASTTGMVPPPPNTTAPATDPTATSQVADQDEEDEWGEMVSSPVATEPTAAGPAGHELGALGIFPQTDEAFPPPSDATAPSAMELPPAKPDPQGQESATGPKFMELSGGSMGSEDSTT